MATKSSRVSKRFLEEARSLGKSTFESSFYMLFSDISIKEHPYPTCMRTQTI